MCSTVEETMAEPPGSSRFRIFAIVPARVKRLIYLLSFSVIGYGFFLVLVTAYLPELGLGSDVVGLILGVSGGALAFSAIPLGMLSDRRGRKWILILGTVGLPPSVAIIGFTTDVNLLIFAGIIAGISEGGFLSTWNALIADQTTLENRDAAFALSFIVTSVVMGLGMALPITFPFFQDMTGLDSIAVHQYAIVFVSLISLISPIALGLLLRGYKETRHEKKLLTKGKTTGLLLKFSGVNGLIGLGAGFIIPLIPTWLFLKFGVLDTFSGPLWAVANLTIGFAAVISPRLSKKYGRVLSIVLTQGASMVFMVTIAYMPDVYVASAFFVVRTGLMNMSVPIMDSYLMGIITKQERGLASAINSLFWRLPNSISTVAGGFLLHAGYLELPFLIAASFYIVAIVLFYWFFKNVKSREEEPSSESSES